MRQKLLVAVAAVLGMASSAQAATITPDIIWGTGNTNRGFTVETVGSLELGIRAKRRYPANDELGVGIVQDINGAYLFDSSESTAGPGQSMWSYDWSINSDVDGGGSGLDAFTYQIMLDTDPTVNESYTIMYDPLATPPSSTGYYLGTNATGNGAASFIGDGSGDFSAFNVAQNSVQPQWVGGLIGAGQFGISLLAFSGNELVNSVNIQVIVDAPVPVPLPAGLPMLAVGLLGLYGLRRWKH